MSTVLATAKAAASIYDNADFNCDGETFELIRGYFDPKNKKKFGYGNAPGGGSAGLYRSKKWGFNIIAFRGSDGSKDWLTDDRQIAFNWKVDRQKDCVMFAEQIKGQSNMAYTILAGHSLGGFLAQMVGTICDIPFITFNAPPAGRQFPKNILQQKSPHGANFRVSWDPVSKTAGSHIGRVITLKHHGMNIFNAHTTEAYLKSIEGSRYAKRDAISVAYSIDSA